MDFIKGRDEELIENLSQGVVETFDASKSKEEVERYIKLEFNDISGVKESQFSMLNGMLTEESEGNYELLLEDVSKEDDLSLYSIGYIDLNYDNYMTILSIFGETVTVKVSKEENEILPYDLYKNLSSNQFKTEEEIRNGYRLLREREVTVEDIVKRNVSLYKK